MLAGCSNGGLGAFGCQGRTCAASFQGPGELDLSSKLGAGALFRVVTVDGPSATVRIAGKDASLVKDEPRHIAGYVVMLAQVNGEDITLRVVGE